MKHAVVVALSFVVACAEAPQSPPVAPAPTPSASPETPSTSPENQPAPPKAKATGRAERARAVLSASLNGQAGDVAALVDAPLYEIHVAVDFELFTYAGGLKLSLVNRERDALRELHFFLYPNVEELTVSGARNLSVTNVRVDGVAASAENRGPSLRVPLAAPLEPGAEAVVEMDFRGVLHRLPDDASDAKKLAVEQLVQMLTGSQKKGGYGVFSYGEGIVSMALWHPILAAYDERGWDIDPGSGQGDRSYFDVGHYRVEVDVPRTARVAATGVEVARADEGERRRLTFAAGAVREFALQMSERYESASRTVDGVTVRSWYLARDRKTGESVLTQAADALRTFNRVYGAYPYSELEIAEAPLIGGAGGVEFPGLVTVAKMFYGQTALAQGAPALAANGFIAETREFVVAHEVAHQWWNAVVGSNSKRHPFVDEALANHSAVRYFAEVHGERAAEKQRELQLRLNYHLARMAGARDRPVDLPADQYDGMLEYAAMVYGKGALFFDAMQKHLGAATFDRVVRAYYARNRFGVAEPADLLEGFAKASPDPAATRRLTRRWLKESHGDADIGALRITSLLKLLGGRELVAQFDPRLAELLDHRGVEELTRLVQQVLTPDGPREDVDYGAVLELAGRIVGADDQELARLLGVAGRVLADAGGPDGVRPSQLVRELGRELAGDDRETRLMMEAMGLFIEALEAPPTR